MSFLFSCISANALDKWLADHQPILPWCQSCVPTCLFSPSLIADARLGLIHLKVAAKAPQKRRPAGVNRRAG
jgi:hypothetical protein